MSEQKVQKIKHIVVSEETHQLLQMYKSRTNTKTLEQVIVDFMELDPNFPTLKELIND